MQEKGLVNKTRSTGRGPTIWLAGPPADLEEFMPLGIEGIVTNTVVLNQYAKPYGSVIALIEAYLEMTDKPVVMEIDGHTVEELLAVGKVFTEMSPQIILKIPCTLNGLKAFSILRAGRSRDVLHDGLLADAGCCRSPGRCRPYSAILRPGARDGRRPDQADPGMCGHVQRMGRPALHHGCAGALGGDCVRGLPRRRR